MSIFKNHLDEDLQANKNKVITGQKDFFATKKKDVLQEKSVSDFYNDRDMMYSDQLSAARKSIPSDNLPDAKSDGTVLLQPQSALHEVPRKVHVTLDNSYQYLEDKDGHYMTQLKNLINGNVNLREEKFSMDDEGEEEENFTLNESEYDVELINKTTSESTLQAVISKMNEIVSTCRKYRLTHLWPWTKRGKERKADVIRTQREAEKRRQAAQQRIKNLNAVEIDKNVLKEDKKGALNKATGGFRRVVNYAKTFIWGMTVRNVINTAGMAVSLPFWAVSSLGKSIDTYFSSSESERKWKFMGAFSIPHPHLPSTWYTHYASKSMSNIVKSEISAKEKERAKYKPGTKKYIDLTVEIDSLTKSIYEKSNSRWHSFFSGSTVLDTFGYSPYLEEHTDYNDSQPI